MGAVYSEGLLNLSATAADDGDDGLFPHNRSLGKQSCIIRMQNEHQKDFHFICYPENTWERQVHEAPLGRRGWVLQERILSLRAIYFSSDQLFWECTEETHAQLAWVL